MTDSDSNFGLVAPVAGIRIAFFLPNAESGGAERAVISVANRVAKVGWKVQLVLGVANGPFLSEVSSSVEIVDLAAKGKFSVLFALWRYLRLHRPSVVMSSLDPANILIVIASKLARFKGRLVISQRSTIGPIYAQFSLLSRTVFQFLIRITYPAADAIICNSFAAANEIKAIPYIRTASVYTIHNGVDLDLTQRRALESISDAWYQQNSLPMVLSVGSLTLFKDRSTLIRAFALLQNRHECRLAILGEKYDAEEKLRIENLLMELGLGDSVYLPGFEPNPFKWMARAAVLVSSSITEGCPNQLLEGLSLGIPIVATDCPGDTAVVLDEGKWGRLVPPANPERMAMAIHEALDDKYPVDGRVRAAQFSPTSTANSYLKILLSDVCSAESEQEKAI